MCQLSSAAGQPSIRLQSNDMIDIPLIEALFRFFRCTWDVRESASSLIDTDHSTLHGEAVLSYTTYRELTLFEYLTYLNCSDQSSIFGSQISMVDSEARNIGVRGCLIG